MRVALPLPSGRLSPNEVLAWGISTCAIGVTLTKIVTSIVDTFESDSRCNGPSIEEDLVLSEKGQSLGLIDPICLAARRAQLIEA